MVPVRHQPFSVRLSGVSLEQRPPPLFRRQLPSNRSLQLRAKRDAPSHKQEGRLRRPSNLIDPGNHRTELHSASEPSPTVSLPWIEPYRTAKFTPVRMKQQPAPGAARNSVNSNIRSPVATAAPPPTRNARVALPPVKATRAPPVPYSNNRLVGPTAIPASAMAPTPNPAPIMQGIRAALSPRRGPPANSKKVKPAKGFRVWFGGNKKGASRRPF